MSPLRMGGATVLGTDGPELTRRVAALHAALEAGGDEIDPDAAARARAVAVKVDERTGISGGHTVVALAGATGSGKSSLFNALIGEPVATIGARRPTTSTPTAALWGSEPAGDLLDWLDVGRRHQVSAAVTPGMPLDGLVLLDLPDFDSREAANQLEAERILQLVDVFVWVTDPQKYADARLHHDFVAALSTHDAVMMGVLNQTDRLRPDEMERCRDDFKRLLVMDGLRHALVLTTSAKTGEGVPELRQRLANAVAGAKAARTRLAGDVVSAADQLAESVADIRPLVTEHSVEELVDSLSVAAGIPTVVDAVARDYLNESVAAAGWPFTRWIRSLRPNPLRRLRLEEDAAAVITPEEARRALGRSSLPPPSPSARAAVSLATRRLADEAGEGLPPRWNEAVVQAARPDETDLADGLDQSVLSTPLRRKAPMWWSVFGVLQLVLAVAVIVGALWLVVLAMTGWLQLPAVPTPTLGVIPLPTLLLVGGLVLGLLVALLARGIGRVGARRRASSVEADLRTGVEEVADRYVVGPVERVLGRHDQMRTELARARGAGS
ncbi:MAG: GTPase [Nostocoides sp.]